MTGRKRNPDRLTERDMAEIVTMVYLCAAYPDEVWAAADRASAILATALRAAMGDESGEGVDVNALLDWSQGNRP